MDPRNLAIVFGPTLIRPVDDSMITMVRDMSDQCRITEMIIHHVSLCFPCSSIQVVAGMLCCSVDLVAVVARMHRRSSLSTYLCDIRRQLVCRTAWHFNSELYLADSLMTALVVCHLF